MKKTTSEFLLYNSIFGLFVGGSYIVASLVFFWSGKNISLNPQLNNIILMLTIAGIFLGVKKFRDDHLEGIISYGKSFSTGIYILTIASFLYALYIFIFYTSDPDLMERFKKVMLSILKQIYGNTPLYETFEKSIQSFLYPASIAVGEFLNKLFFGIILTLFLAGILRKRVSRY